MRKLVFILLISLWFLVCASTDLNAAVKYVNKDASCPGNGSSATPYCTIQGAVNTAVAGDVIRIKQASSAYDESVSAISSGTSGAPITISAESGETPIWTYSGNGSTAAALNILNQDYWIVQNLTFDGTAVLTSRQAVWMSSTNSTQRYGLQFLNNTIKNWGQLVPLSGVTGLNIGGDGSIVRGNVFDGIPRDSLGPSGGKNLLVENNEFKNMRCGLNSDMTVHAAAIRLVYGDVAGGMSVKNNNIHDPRPQSDCLLADAANMTAFGIWTDVGAYNGTIDGNTIHDFLNVTSIGLHLEYDTHGWTVKNNIFYTISYNAIRHNPTTSGTVNTYTNNTIYNVGSGSTGWGIQISSGYGIFKNNIIYNSAAAQIRVTTDTVPSLTIDYNDYWDTAGGNKVGNWDPTLYNFSGWKTKCACDAHSINANPLFISPTSSFGLQSISPARTASDIGSYIGAVKPGVNAATCNLADVQAAVNLAGNGDLVTIPAGSCAWSSSLILTRGITLLGSGQCTLDSKGRATACPTVIKDGTSSGLKGALIDWTCAAGQNHRLSAIMFQNGTRLTESSNGLIHFGCTNASGTTIRIDHNVFDHLKGLALRLETAVGVADHNTLLTGYLPIHFGDPDWNKTYGSSDNGDASWADDVVFGDGRFMFWEDNTLSWDNVAGPIRGCTDANRGGRFVIRRNDLVNCNVQTHGTESGGRARGVMAVEIYQNSINNPNLNHMVFLRSGSALTWGNTGTNILGAPDGDYALVMENNRSNNNFSPFGQADGTSPWDANDPGNPYYSGTASSGSTTTVTVSGSPWAVNQWANYVVKKTGCTPTLASGDSYNRCAALIISNTADTLTFYAGSGFPQTAAMTFTAGDGFQINKVVETIDQPGRSKGGDLNNQTNPSPPVGWNNQIDFPIYEWRNTNGGHDIHNHRGLTCPPTICRVNEHYFDYTTTFSGNSGVGAGLRSARPASTTTGVAYWATDQGGDWDHSNSSANDGCLDKVVSGAWVNCWYRPYSYPHPLADGTATVVTEPPPPPPPSTPNAPVLSSITPSSGKQGSTVSATLTGSGFETGAILTISGTGVSPAGMTISATSIKTSLVIATTATATARTVTVTTSGGTSNALIFTVKFVPPGQQRKTTASSSTTRKTSAR